MKATKARATLRRKTYRVGKKATKATATRGRKGKGTYRGAKKPTAKPTSKKPKKPKKPTSKKLTTAKKPPTKPKKPPSKPTKTKKTINYGVRGAVKSPSIKKTKAGVWRPSARAMFNDGVKIGSRVCYGGKEHVLKQRPNGSPYFAPMRFD